MARVTHYDIGKVWQPQATFAVGTTNTDPTNLTVRQQDAAGTESVLLNNVLVSTLNPSSVPVAKTATGIFKLNPGITLTSAGHWFVRFEGTGAVTTAEEHEAVVDPSEFTSNAGIDTTALVSLADAKDWLNQQQIDTGEDLELVRLVNDMSSRFMEEAQREIRVYGTNPQVRTFDADKTALYRKIIWVGDLSSFTAVRILDRDGILVETVLTGDITPLPRNRPVWEPIRALRFSADVGGLREDYQIEVTGNWGFPSVPGNVRQAVLEAVAAARGRQVESYRQDLSSPGQQAAGTVVLLGTRPQIISLPPAAQAVAWYYRDQVIL